MPVPDGKMRLKLELYPLNGVSLKSTFHPSIEYSYEN